MESYSYEDEAIDAIRNWLIGLLKDRKWCEARRVGKALEMLVEDRNKPTAEAPDCGRAERIR